MEYPTAKLKDLSHADDDEDDIFLVEVEPSEQQVLAAEREVAEVEEEMQDIQVVQELLVRSAGGLEQTDRRRKAARLEEIFNFGVKREKGEDDLQYRSRKSQEVAKWQIALEEQGLACTTPLSEIKKEVKEDAPEEIKAELRRLLTKMKQGKEKQREGLQEEIMALDELDTFIEDTDLKFLGPALRNLTFADVLRGTVFDVKAEVVESDSEEDLPTTTEIGPSTSQTKTLPDTRLDLLKKAEAEKRAVSYETGAISSTSSWDPVRKGKKICRSGRMVWSYLYMCPAQGCTKKASTSKWGMDSHIRENHSLQYYGPCPHCYKRGSGTIFYTKNREVYRMHLRDNHPDAVPRPRKRLYEAEEEEEEDVE